MHVGKRPEVKTKGKRFIKVDTSWLNKPTAAKTFATEGFSYKMTQVLISINALQGSWAAEAYRDSNRKIHLLHLPSSHALLTVHTNFTTTNKILLILALNSKDSFLLLF